LSATVHGNVPCLTRGSGTRQTRVIIVVIIIAGASGDAEEAQLDLRPPRAVLSTDDSAISCATSANIAPKKEGQTRKKIWGGSSHEAFCEDDAVARGGRHAPHTAVDLPLGEVHKTLGQRHVRFVRARQAAEAPCRNAVFVELYFMFVPILPWQMIGGFNQKTAAQKRFRTAVAVGVLKLETDSDESVQELAVAVVEEAVTAAGFVVVIAVEPAPGAGARARVHADVVATHAATAQPAQSTACTA
jgi:hypothetical protein